MAGWHESSIFLAGKLEVGNWKLKTQDFSLISQNLIEFLFSKLLSILEYFRG